MSDDADPQASDALAEQRVVVRYRLVRWRSADNEVGPFRADTIFAALRLIRLERDGVRFAADSLVERAVFCELVSGNDNRPRRGNSGSISVNFGMFRDRKNAISSSNFAGNCTSFPPGRLRLPPFKSLLLGVFSAIGERVRASIYRL